DYVTIVGASEVRPDLRPDQTSGQAPQKVDHDPSRHLFDLPLAKMPYDTAPPSAISPSATPGFSFCCLDQCCHEKHSQLA
ncbi:uncharacterized protein PgNI_03228, partial [Pyricularia grisea]|uniref:Uncharacterized protein n=1 Tax=Pyricularia grisea TaxID=148305 RepID=A0A6P8BBD1_PYRGI